MFSEILADTRKIEKIPADKISILVLRSAKKYLAALNVVAPLLNRRSTWEQGDHFLKAGANLYTLQSEFQGKEYTTLGSYNLLDKDGNTVGLQSGLSGETIALLVAHGVVESLTKNPIDDSKFNNIPIEKIKELIEKFAKKGRELLVASILSALAHEGNSFLGRKVVNDILISLGENNTIKNMIIEDLHLLGVFNGDKIKPIGVKKGQELLKNYLDSHQDLVRDLPKEILSF